MTPTPLAGIQKTFPEIQLCPKPDEKVRALQLPICASGSQRVCKPHLD